MCHCVAPVFDYLLLAHFPHCADREQKNYHILNPVNPQEKEIRVIINNVDEQTTYHYEANRVVSSR